MPDYGRLTAFRSATGFGVRVDSGTAYIGAVITPYYDSLLAKVTVRGANGEEANARSEPVFRSTIETKDCWWFLPTIVSISKSPKRERCSISAGLSWMLLRFASWPRVSIEPYFLFL